MPHDASALGPRPVGMAALVDILDAVPASIALIGPDGTILAVNRGWQDFHADNGGRRERGGGWGNYFDACPAQDPLARRIALGLRDVLSHKSPRFEQIYPCHSPARPRWFKCLITPIRDLGAIAAHFDITDTVDQADTLAEAAGANQDWVDELSHRLRGPLHQLLSALTLLDRRMVDRDGVRLLNNVLAGAQAIDRALESFPFLASRQDAPASPGTTPTSPRLILAVDDDPACLVLSAAHVELCGHLCVTAQSAAQACALSLQHRFDLAFLDIRLGDQDGTVLLRALRLLDPGLVAVAVTGNCGGADVIRYRAAGFDHILSKPVVAERWRQTIDTFSGHAAAPPLDDLMVSGPLRTIAADLGQAALEKFLAQAVQTLDSCGLWLDDGQHDPVAVAHRLKGVAAATGLRRLAAAAERAEAAASPDWPAQRLLLSALIEDGIQRLRNFPAPRGYSLSR